MISAETAADPEITSMEPGYVGEVWTYCGLRVAHNGLALVSEWMTPDGDTHRYAWKRGDPARAIGFPYRVEVNPERGIAKLGTIPNSDDFHPDRSAWYAAEHAAKTAVAIERNIQRLAKDDPLSEHFDALAAAYGRIIGYAERAAFLAYVQARVSAAPRVRRP